MAIMIRSKKAAKIVKKILGIPENDTKGKIKKTIENIKHLDYNDASELR